MKVPQEDLNSSDEEFKQRAKLDKEIYKFWEKMALKYINLRLGISGSARYTNEITFTTSMNGGFLEL